MPHELKYSVVPESESMARGMMERIELMGRSTKFFVIHRFRQVDRSRRPPIHASFGKAGMDVDPRPNPRRGVDP